MSTSASSPAVNRWPSSERPRERLKLYGPSALSDAELIAILLRSGLPGKDVIALSRELLAEFGGLRGLFSLDWNSLCKMKGLGPAKAAALLAARELAERSLKEKVLAGNIIRDPQSVVDYVTLAMRDCKKEIFKVLYLNKANCVLGERDLFHGTVDEAAVYLRDVVKSALDYYATAIILVHNHPSGRTQPSREDKELTEKIQSACRLVNIKVLDHLIIGRDGTLSFREMGLLED